QCDCREDFAEVRIPFLPKPDESVLDFCGIHIIISTKRERIAAGWFFLFLCPFYLDSWRAYPARLLRFRQDFFVHTWIL
ncbi:MAG: hypothetical protein ACI4IV_03935, partial [Acutalibacteraceae bacterium]